MAATSPYTPNDYQAVSNYRPYELPVNDIFKGIAAQSAFWDAGAARVKHVYENALDLTLTSDANIEVKKKFMEDADKQLTKLSTMNLADPSVQRQGIGIYAPLFKDEAIMYDHQLTQTLSSIYRDANSYKTKKLSNTGPEGEGYTARNLAYALDGFENFNSKTPRDPALMKEMYGKLGQKAYTPYYNPAQEFDNVLKHCHGASSVKQDVASNYLYFDETSKTGASSAETANCFMQGLSDKAKEQMGIDGWAYYKFNPKGAELLVKDHYQYAVGPVSQALQAIKGKLAAYKDLSNPTEEDKAAIKELTDALPTYQKLFDTRTKEYNEMVGGNALNYIKENFNTIAAGIYMNRQYMDLGEAFRNDKTTHKLTANASGIAQYNALQKAYSDERNHNYRLSEMAQKFEYDKQLKQLSGEIPTNNIEMLHPEVTSNINTGQDYDQNKFNIEMQLADKALDDSYQTLAQYILSKDPSADPHNMTHAFLLNYAEVQSKSKDPDKKFVEFMDAYNNAKKISMDKHIQQQSINKIVDNEFQKDPDYNKFKSTVITLSDGTVIQGDDLAKIQRKEVTRLQGRSDLPIFDHWAYEYNGKLYTEDETGGGLFSTNGNMTSSDRKQMSNFFSDLGNMSSKMNKRKDQLYRKSWYDAQQFMAPRFNPKKNPMVDQRIRNILGVPEGEDTKNGYELLGHDESGQNLYVMPTDASGNRRQVTADDLATAAKIERNVKKINIGGNSVLMIPYSLPVIPGLPSIQQKYDISKLRDFHTLMESQLRNLGSYASSEDLKNTDGTPYPYSSYSFKTPSGANVKVVAIKANGRTVLSPSRQLKDGSWDNNYRTYSTPEEVILAFSADAPPTAR